MTLTNCVHYFQNNPRFISIIILCQTEYQPTIAKVGVNLYWRWDNFRTMIQQIPTNLAAIASWVFVPLTANTFLDLAPRNKVGIIPTSMAPSSLYIYTLTWETYSYKSNAPDVLDDATSKASTTFLMLLTSLVPSTYSNASWDAMDSSMSRFLPKPLTLFSKTLHTFTWVSHSKPIDEAYATIDRNN